MDKLRVLCLHGYRQNGAKLRGRMASYRRTFKSSVEFVFVDGPIAIPYEPTSEEHINSEAPEEDVAQFAWWAFELDEETGRHKYSHVEEAVEYLAKIYREQGPFDGVFGFSMGGMMASLLLQQQLDKPTEENPFSFKFGIFFAAATNSMDPRYPVPTTKIDIPTLHVMGETDAVVILSRSQELASLYADPVVLQHPGGHYIPTNKDPKDVMRDFIKKQIAARA